MERTKFNVDKDIAKRTYAGITFDSVLEMRYYRDVCCPLLESGKLLECKLQVPYELQPKFIHDNRTVQPIKYVADFVLKFANGSVVVVDTKGCPDSVATLKRKMFWYVYPDINYRWITYIKKYGGWIEYDRYKRLKNQEKREKKNEKV